MDQSDGDIVADITVSKGVNAEITYCLVEKDGVYSLKVSSSDTVENEVFVYDIARSRKEALSLARLLSENLVFPCHVLDVLDDLLGT